MQHSIAAKYAARPAAQFVHPSPRARERRLGLRIAGSFQAGLRPATVLRRPDVSALARLRGGWRAFRAPAAPGPPSGRPRPAVAMHWARSGRAGGGPPVQRRHGAVARLREATATSAGGIVIRFEDGMPAARRRVAAGASATS